MKKVYLDFHGKKHSLYDNLVKYPPEGYEFMMGNTPLSKFTKSVSGISFMPQLLMRSINNIVPVSILKPYLDRNSKLPADVSMVYSSGHIIFKKIPWVMDLEFVTHMAGYDLKSFNRYKKTLQKALESDNCIRVMPWTNAGKKTIDLSFDSDKIHEKTEAVHLAVPGKDFTKKYDSDKIKIFFVSSQNLPKDFEIKGGKEVFDAFSIISKEYKNVELTVRSYMPEKLKAKYSKLDNVKIIDQVIPWSMLEGEFKSSDIFLFPSHHTPGLAILDAMSYELPIITTDVWANPEMVEDGKNGFLIKKSESIQYTIQNNIPNWSSKESLDAIHKGTDPKVVRQITEKLRVLIEDEKLRTSMGRAGRKEVETGKFSIAKRNEKLKKIFSL